MEHVIEIYKDLSGEWQLLTSSGMPDNALRADYVLPAGYMRHNDQIIDKQGYVATLATAYDTLPRIVCHGHVLSMRQATRFDLEIAARLRKYSKQVKHLSLSEKLKRCVRRRTTFENEYNVNLAAFERNLMPWLSPLEMVRKG